MKVLQVVREWSRQGHERLFESKWEETKRDLLGGLDLDPPKNRKVMQVWL